MSILTVAFLFLGLLQLHLILPTEGNEALEKMNIEDIPDPADMPCKSAVSMLTKRMMGGISVCTKQMKFKNAKEKSAKMSCIMRCVAINEGLLYSDGFFNMDKFNKFVKKEVPPNLREKAVPIVLSCFEKHQIKDQSDEFCKNYDPLIKCLMDKIPTITALDYHIPPSYRCGKFLATGK